MKNNKPIFFIIFAVVAAAICAMFAVNWLSLDVPTVVKVIPTAMTFAFAVAAIAIAAWKVNVSRKSTVKAKSKRK